MALFPFSISDIEDPECIRVVLYASGRMGHAPLNALLNQMRQDIECFDRKQSKDTTQLTKRVDELEKKLKTILQDPEDAKSKQESQNVQSGKEESERVIAGSDTKLQSHASVNSVNIVGSDDLDIHSVLSTAIISEGIEFQPHKLIKFTGNNI
ncbi:Uncharacterised protein [Candidatus Bartonella washoeensis]|uniref:Uncharacterized protein n=1 Tax=Candidatus Bartonella washoeensis Sb944nv TaxID=1094563 RepID=J0PVY2_9HYPH|nr:hypothetical protein [Bartonella washoeensis]EJF76796.1 hypothetical protein MCQ_01659 [Bartonella washoeensis Sb944nv]SPU27951.1 Uncharacterised protein [Bartonella washoeensis]